MTFWYPSKPILLPSTAPVLEELDVDPDWIAEPKMNGWRALASLGPDGRVQIVTRENRPLEGLEDIRRRLQRRLQPGLEIDGELLFRGPHATSPRYFPFDVPLVDGFPNPKPFEQRRADLLSLLGPCKRGPLTIPRQVQKDKIRFLGDVLSDPDIEGIVLKYRASGVHLSLRASALNPQWFKVKESYHR